MPDTKVAQRGSRKEKQGVVVSRSGDKSVVVMVERLKRHPVYGKVIRVLRKFHAHDEENRARVGDRVRILECRPMSRTKRWRVVEIIGGRRAAEAAGES